MDSTSPDIALGALGMVGMALAGIGGLATFVFWIISIVKAFQAKDTLWGVLTIFIGICGLIWLFMNGHKKLGVWWLIFLILGAVGYAMVFPAIMAASTQLQPQ